jgi:uncharacterized protein
MMLLSSARKAVAVAPQKGLSAPSPPRFALSALGFRGRVADCENENRDAQNEIQRAEHHDRKGCPRSSHRCTRGRASQTSSWTRLRSDPRASLKTIIGTLPIITPCTIHKAYAAEASRSLKEPLPEGSLALFSASAGQRALDRLGDGDQDPHSVFTRTLLGHLDDAGSVVRLARAVRAEVTELANSVQYQQTPAYLDELVGPPVVLVPGPSDVASATPPPSAPPLPRAPPPPQPQPPPAPATDGSVCGSAAPGPPAFDCSRARRLTEIAICRDPRLGSCDRMLNVAFYEAQARAGRGAVALRRDQEAWLARRDACAGAGGQGPAAVADCIGRAYDERIAELEVVQTQAPIAAPVSPSFNCRYARTPVEQAICSDPALAAKDRRMARLYERAGGSRFGPVEPTQSAWLATRDACARVAGPALHACIHEAYDARIAELGG